jgi:alpha-tubulin suppressor-like RCC1 family protein
MGAMRRLMTAVVFSSLAAAGAAHATDAVQWRVEDGGNGHWYQLHSFQGPTTRSSALEFATARNAALACLETEPENRWVASTFTGAMGLPVGQAWIGGVRTNGVWRWETGGLIDFLAWNCNHCHPTCQPDYTCEDFLAVMCIAEGVARFNNVGDCLGTGEGQALLEWSADCNNDGIVDFGQIRNRQLADSNSNNIPDICEAGFASSTPNSGTAPTVPLRDFDMGEGLTIGIKPNGSLIAWGSYNVTPPTGSFKSVSTGRNCAIAIDGNGSLVPFGANEYGRLNVPTGAFRSVSAADATWHAAGVRADGTIACWGFNNYGQANAPTGAFSAVAAGGHEVWSGFTVAVRSDGTLAAWGNNTWGQRNVPVGNNYRTISAGYYHALAIRSDNTLAGWGWNQHGQASVPAGQYLGVATGSTEILTSRN